EGVADVWSWVCAAAALAAPDQTRTFSHQAFTAVCDKSSLSGSTLRRRDDVEGASRNRLRGRS
ncbi:hypothetical protein, partial [Sphingomonas sp. Leaf62]|uniref:hypothetical protein n=1 Tax=Sphingomonas sp. Leaf62 TaxID=1736228 RepID=UPI001F2BEC95